MSVDSKQVNECCQLSSVDQRLVIDKETWSALKSLWLRYEGDSTELLPKFDDNPKELPAIIYNESWR